VQVTAAILRVTCCLIAQEEGRNNQEERGARFQRKRSLKPSENDENADATRHGGGGKRCAAERKGREGAEYIGKGK